MAPRLFARIGARVPVIHAPMAGAGGVDLAIAAIAGGGVGSLPCAMLGAEAITEQARTVRDAVNGPLDLNLFYQPLPVGADDAIAPWPATLGSDCAAEATKDGSPPSQAPSVRRVCGRGGEAGAGELSLRAAVVGVARPVRALRSPCR